VRLIDGRGHRDDDEIGLRQRRGIGGDRQQLRRLEIRATDLAGRVDEFLITGDLGGRQIIADGAVFLAEFDRQRQTDIAEADDGDDRGSVEPRSCGAAIFSLP
jgi:hypothetical protein